MQYHGAGAAAVGLKCSDDDEVRVLGLGRDAQETVAVRGEGLGYLTVGEDFVWFARASSDGGYVQYLWRLSTGELTTVGQGLVSGAAVIGGDFFSWATFHGAAGTRTLAKLAD
ncbi:MAG: hypothetical protein JWN22_2967 [Nocardioides sp.]|nr:hypothetical protein [Nocardioides sp.]